VNTQWLKQLEEARTFQARPDYEIETAPMFEDVFHGERDLQLGIPTHRAHYGTRYRFVGTLNRQPEMFQEIKIVGKMLPEVIFVVRGFCNGKVIAEADGPLTSPDKSAPSRI
jgi:hypothetical protein